MTKAQKTEKIAELSEILDQSENILLADISGLKAAQSTALYKLCNERGVQLSVVKNRLMVKAMEKSNKDFGTLPEVVKGNTCFMISERHKSSAEIIKTFAKKEGKPILKGALVKDALFMGDDKLEVLIALKSKEEMIADIVSLLQVPTLNTIGALKSNGARLLGIVEKIAHKQ